MSKMACAAVAAAMMISSPVLAQTAGTTGRSAVQNPTLNENQNTPDRSAGAPANLSNDVRTGSTSANGNTATGGMVGRGQGGSN